MANNGAVYIYIYNVPVDAVFFLYTFKYFTTVRENIARKSSTFRPLEDNNNNNIKWYTRQLIESKYLYIYIYIYDTVTYHGAIIWLYIYIIYKREFIVRDRGSVPPRTFCITILFVFCFIFSLFFVPPPPSPDLNASLFHLLPSSRGTTAPIIVNIIETRETHSKNFIPPPS